MLIRPQPWLHDPLPDGRTHPSIEEGKLYIVTAIQYDDLQVLNTLGEPILVPAQLFDIVDGWIPTDWVSETDDDGCLGWHGPVECAAPGFFESWHEGNGRAREMFAKAYEHLYQHYSDRLSAQDLLLVRRKPA